MGMKTRTNFTHRIDMWDYAGENIIKHLRGIEDYEVAEATLSAVKRWPKAAITCASSPSKRA